MLNTSSNFLIKNVSKLSTTKLGEVRIKKNLKLEDDINAVSFCKEIVKSPDSKITRRGKNWYVSNDDCVITINAYSYTIITAHMI